MGVFRTRGIFARASPLCPFPQIQGRETGAPQNQGPISSSDALSETAASEEELGPGRVRRQVQSDGSEVILGDHDIPRAREEEYNTAPPGSASDPAWRWRAPDSTFLHPDDDPSILLETWDEQESGSATSTGGEDDPPQHDEHFDDVDVDSNVVGAGDILNSLAKEDRFDYNPAVHVAPGEEDGSLLLHGDIRFMYPEEGEDRPLLLLTRTVEAPSSDLTYFVQKLTQNFLQDKALRYERQRKTSHFPLLINGDMHPEEEEVSPPPPPPPRRVSSSDSSPHSLAEEGSSWPTYFLQTKDKDDPLYERQGKISPSARSSRKKEPLGNKTRGLFLEDGAAEESSPSDEDEEVVDSWSWPEQDGGFHFQEVSDAVELDSWNVKWKKTLLNEGKKNGVTFMLKKHKPGFKKAGLRAGPSNAAIGLGQRKARSSIGWGFVSRIGCWNCRRRGEEAGKKRERVAKEQAQKAEERAKKVAKARLIQKRQEAHTAKFGRRRRRRGTGEVNPPSRPCQKYHHYDDPEMTLSAAGLLSHNTAQTGTFKKLYQIATVDACAEQCTMTYGCNFWRYIGPQSGYIPKSCFLKKRTSRKVYYHAYYYVGKVCPLSPKACKIYKGFTDKGGAAVEVTKEEATDSCNKRCTFNDACKSFVYSTRSKTCYQRGQYVLNSAHATDQGTDWALKCPIKYPPYPIKKGQTLNGMTRLTDYGFVARDCRKPAKYLTGIAKGIDLVGAATKCEGIRAHNKQVIFMGEGNSLWQGEGTLKRKAMWGGCWGEEGNGWMGREAGVGTRWGDATSCVVDLQRAMRQRDAERDATIFWWHCESAVDLQAVVSSVLRSKYSGDTRPTVRSG